MYRASERLARYVRNLVADIQESIQSIEAKRLEVRFVAREICLGGLRGFSLLSCCIQLLSERDHLGPGLEKASRCGVSFSNYLSTVHVCRPPSVLGSIGK